MSENTVRALLITVVLVGWALLLTHCPMLVTL